ncbi:hypothetical protein PAECIP111891_04234 [Paenibacillus allorhizoplanae]|uniref:Rad50/SbcC-type AAA domain-containing protein n=1 Tax=Paenibacillus allorhizoplanae TaxID=2905648 RepID=A0ABN8GT61_9BACL|nr:AAA family ATPase [Paenibacillus allorhizoplanae]CAH1215231.1 hypothetical protein PAECIP111891_04234 [Paenibacillus allorhizoplanae]
MSAIVLLKLKQRNFKGIREFTLDTAGSDVNIFGDNATYKTSQFDSFTWLLFDKDSQNKKDFDIKTLDSNNKAFSGLEHEVEGVLSIDGRTKTLRKVYKEKWTKKRGSATDEFTGHETDYFIDEVPVKKTEYTAFVDSIMNEEVFKLLTNPSYFNEVLDWKKRRKTLLEVCGDVSNDDVISGNAALSKLPAILGDRSIEDHRKVIMTKRTNINDEIKKIPIRIDEARRSRPDVAELNSEQISKQLAAVKTHIEAKESELHRIQTGGEISVKETRLREIEGELLQIKNNAQSSSMDRVNSQRQTVSGIQIKLSDLDFEIKQSERSIASKQDIINDNEAKAVKLRTEWSEVNASVLEHVHSEENCPSCGQSLPIEQVTAAFQKAVSDFNLKKSERLSEISTKGKSLKADRERLAAEITDINGRLVEFKEKSSIFSGELLSANEKLNKFQSGIKDVTQDPAYVQKLQEKSAVESEILGLRSASLGSIEQVRDTLSKLRLDADRLEQSRAKMSQIAEIDRRIDSLKDQERELAAEYERLEEELYLTEEFIRTKVSMLESKINSKFKQVKFKLFEQQINGGLDETCEAMIGGVPYSTGLNRAAQMNGGLDIINTLSEHYGIVAPIFIDNAEAVTQLIETKGQQIRLIVSATDKKLRVETKTIQEAI